MAFYTTIGVPTAILVGIFFTAVTGWVLLDDVWHGAAFTTKHLMTIAVLMGTVYYGHRFQLQVRMWKFWTAAGCGLLFLGGTALCVSMSAGRNAEVTTHKAQSANAVNSGRAAAQKDRDEARIRYQAALKAEEEECSSGSGAKCQSKRITRMVRREDYDTAETKLREQQPEVVAHADIKHAAELYARLPYVTADARSIEALLLLVQPFLMSLFCEIGAILGFGIGLGHKAREAPAAPKAKDLPEAKPCVSSPVHEAPVHELHELKASRTNEFRGGTPKATALADLLAYIAAHGCVPSQDFLRERWKLRSRGTISGWLTEWETAGLVQRQRDGRFKVTSSRTSRTERMN